MARYSSSGVTYAIGPGGMSPAVKLLIIANVTMFVVSWLLPVIVSPLGLSPEAVLTKGWIWQPATYMFLHADVMHILFNMLGLWMFGVELERMWGTRFFARYYAVTGIGAALITIAVSLLPLPFSPRIYQSLTIGASGAIYALLLAYGLSFPNRPIYLYFLFQVPAKYFVMIVGAVALYLIHQQRSRRHRSRRSSRRARGRLPVSHRAATDALEPDRRDQISLHPLETDADAQEVRRVLRRADERPHPLIRCQSQRHQDTEAHGLFLGHREPRSLCVFVSLCLCD